MIKVASITKLENGSIVTPKGFSAIGTVNGLKKKKKDLGQSFVTYQHHVPLCIQRIKYKQPLASNEG